jgi:molecular chaperone GrpE
MMKRDKKQPEPSPHTEESAAPGEADQTVGTAAPAAENSAEGSAEPAGDVEEEIARLKNQYLRLMADFDNYRKRQARERDDFVKRSNERLLGDLLPVVDHLEMALTKIENTQDPFAAGVKLVYEQFIAVLKRCGMEPVQARGESFNPELHEAISYIPSPSVPSGRVIDQLRCGWTISGHLMRAAQVIVSSGEPP